MEKSEEMQIRELLDKISGSLDDEEFKLFQDIRVRLEWLRHNFMGVLEILKSGETLTPEEAEALLTKVKHPILRVFTSGQ